LGRFAPDRGACCDPSAMMFGPYMRAMSAAPGGVVSAYGGPDDGSSPAQKLAAVVEAAPCVCLKIGESRQLNRESG
jgi:hypothetical protein